MKGKTGLWLAAALVIAALVMALGGSTTQDASTREERRIAEVLSAIDGAGKVEVALFGAQESGSLTGGTFEPTGAVIVAQGAEDVGVKLQLIRAARTLLGLPESAVDVFVMEESRK